MTFYQCLWLWYSKHSLIRPRRNLEIWLNYPNDWIKKRTEKRLKLNFLLLSKVLTDGLMPSALKTHVQKHASESSVTKRHVPKKLCTKKKKKEKTKKSKFYEPTSTPHAQQNKTKKKFAVSDAQDGPHTMLWRSVLRAHAEKALRRLWRRAARPSATKKI